MTERPDANGVLWWPTTDGEVALVVQAGVVTDAKPLHAAEKLVGHDARRLWRSGRAHNLELRWVDGMAPFQPFTVIAKTRVRSWRYLARGVPAGNHTLTLGRLPDGRWWTEDTADPCGWLYPDEQSARDEIERRLAVDPDRWTEVGFPTGPTRNGQGLRNQSSGTSSDGGGG